MLFLVNGMMDELNRDIDFDSLCKEIQKKCCFNKKMAEKLSTIFLSLYSIANKEEWKNRKLEGLSQFLKMNFSCIWDGLSIWQTEGGSVDCHYEAEMILRPIDPDCIGKKLSDLLNKNPFMTREAITDFYENDIRNWLDEEFERYCSCEDYYQPVVEESLKGIVHVKTTISRLLKILNLIIIWRNGVGRMALRSYLMKVTDMMMDTSHLSHGTFIND